MKISATSDASRNARYARRLAIALAWTIVTACLALVVVTTILTIRNRYDPDRDPLDYVVPVLALLNPVVGALIVSRRPGNAIGWLLCVLGFALCANGAIEAYVRAVDWFAVPRQLPPGWPWVAWFGTTFLVPAIGAALTFGLLLFPDGRLPSPRWRPVAWLAGYVVVGLAVALAFGNDSVVEGQRASTRVPNPARVEAVAWLVDSTDTFLVGWLWFVAIVSAAASLVDRMRRARGVERQQLKMIAFVGSVIALLPVAVVAGGTLGSSTAVGLDNLVWYGYNVGTLVAVPVAVGAAILRYRLYEVDRLINRTLVYGLLTLALGLVYVAAVLLLQGALRPLTRSSDLAVAGSTLAVAALFHPARERVQRAVDRRFYRRKYDAARTVELFAARLRDEVDLDALAADLTAVVRETVEPAHVGLWLREAPGREIGAAGTGRGPRRG